MKIYRSIILLLPITILMFFIVMQGVSLSYSYWLDKGKLFREVRHQTLVDASRLARMAEADLANAKSKIEQELMLYGTELNNTATVLIDPDGRVLLAQNSAWKGRFFGDVLPGIDVDRFYRARDGLQANELADASQTRFEVFVPFAFPAAAGELVSQKRGAVYIANDLSSALSRYRAQNLIAHLPLLALALLFAATLAFWLHVRVVRPISRIAEASRRLSQDINARAPGKGIGEIGELASAFNATARQLAEQQKHLQLSAQVFDTANEAILITDAKTKIVAINPAFTRITGYSEADAIGKSVNILQSGRHERSFYRAMWNELLANGKWSGEIEDRRKNGEVYTEWLNISSVKNAKGETTHYVETFADLTEVRRAQQLAERLSSFDLLTGLYNRETFINTLANRLAEARRGQSLADLIIIDVDRFKEINDALGLGTGDNLLKLIAERFKKVLYEDEVLARLGSDEFAVVTPLLKSGREAAARYTLLLAERLSASLREQLTLNDKQFKLDISVGIALFPESPDETASDVMRQADLALRQSKLLGGGRITFFEENMGEYVRERYELEQELRLGISAGQLRVFLQPQVDALGQHVGAEALVRWKHPTKGMVSPAAFIPLAEASDLIVSIDNWMLQEVCQLLAELDKEGSSLNISVNVSPRHFQQADFVEQIKLHLAKTGADPAHLVLEVTEGLVIGDYADVVGKMDLLSELGIHFSMDDFGTGYSSLAYLKRLPIHEIKIDKSFIQDIPTDSNDAALVETIISVARHLKLKVVAEGVETEAQASFLNSQGDVIHQGYFYGKPEPMENWLAARALTSGG